MTMLLNESIGKKIQKCMQSQKRCYQFFKNLQVNVLPQEKQKHQRYERQFERVAKIQTVSLSKLNEFYKNIQEQLKLAKIAKQKEMQIKKQKQSQLKVVDGSEKKPQKEQLMNKLAKFMNEGRQYEIIRSTKKNNKLQPEFTGQNEIFQNVELKQPTVERMKKQDRNEKMQQNRKQSVQERQQIKEQHFFEIDLLINKNKNAQAIKSSHQIKLIQQQRFRQLPQSRPKKFQTNQAKSKSKQKPTFNLSNFSSFNANSLTQNQNQKPINQFSEKQKQFYQKQFIYLVKRIEFISGKKLSQKGIQKVIAQLMKCGEEGKVYQRKMNKKSRLAVKQNQIKDIKDEKGVSNFMSKSSISKRLKTHNQSISNSSTVNAKQIKQTSFTFQEKQKSISKQKLMNAKVTPQKNFNSLEPNKSTSIQFQSHIRKHSNFVQNERDVSSKKVGEKQKEKLPRKEVSYKVLMERKKGQKEKEKQNLNISGLSQIKKKQPVELTNPCNNNLTTSKQNQLKQIPLHTNCKRENSLKIIVQSKSSDKKYQTLYFFFNTTKQSQIKNQIDKYCLQNKLQLKHKKSIQEAVKNHKAIITLKQ